MKTMYIPKGETVTHDTLITDHLVVQGCLRVTSDLKAKSISGDGVIIADRIFADNIRTDELEAASVICKRLIAKRVHTSKLVISESGAVSCFLSAAYVEAGKLTVTASEIGEIEAQEVIHLPSKRRSLLGLLLVSALRSLWLWLTLPASVGEAIDTEYTQAAKTGEPEKVIDPFSDAAGSVFRDAA